MKSIKNLLRNRDFILLLALALGLTLGQGARWTERAVVPALAVVMVLSTMGVSGSIFLSPRQLWMPALAGLAMSYGVLGSLLLGLNFLFIHDAALRHGFIIMAAVPPAIAVIPFTFLLNGNSAFTLIAAIGCYLGALLLTPLIILWFIGPGFIDSGKILTIMVELILIPVILSRILLWSRISERIEPAKGAITNWSFFLVVYTIVGLNRDILFAQPLAFLPAAFIALASTFVLGFVIEWTCRFFRLDAKKVISLILLGTHKNTGLAAGLALALFSEKTAVPATISTIFMLVYIIWLSVKQRWDR
ncbi:MAG: bile acid:sodium symporter [Thermodesulfobacteriota bacterium]|nr:bile acid:sodium symporter [Thermodesulfobacteriota bacterium]